MKASHRLIFICALACALGFAFAALSTYDFIAHLDRQETERLPVAGLSTIAWNTGRHMEAWYGIMGIGAVCHTLNPRLFPEQLTYIVNHAADEVIFVDRSVAALLWPLIPTFETVRHIVVMDDGRGELPIDVVAFPDVLEAAGVNLNLTPVQVARCIDEAGVGFMFAPAHHGAMKHAIGPRQELGLRTIFNMLGPLTNPAGARRQVVGVFDTSLCKIFVEVLARLGSEHVIALRSEDGLDEISLAAPTYIAELRNGVVSEYTIEPSQFGIRQTSLEGLKVTSAQESLDLIRDALGKRSTSAGEKAADLIAMNAGAAIYVAGVENDLRTSVALAEDIIASGLAGEKLKQLAELSQCFQPV